MRIVYNLFTISINTFYLYFRDLLKINLNQNINLNLSLCLLANISICETSKQERFLVVTYNPTSQESSHYVRLPIDEKYVYRITGPNGEETYDIFDSISKFEYVKEAVRPSYKELVFAASNVPPLGMKVYYVEKIDKAITDEYEPLTDLVEDHTFGTQVYIDRIDRNSNFT